MREQDPPLDEAQRALVEKKFELLQQASFGFTQDRLLHVQEDDLKRWTDECTGELRRKIASAAPPHTKIALIAFRKLRCISLQCLPRQMPYKRVVVALIFLISLLTTRMADGQVPAAAVGAFWAAQPGPIRMRCIFLSEPDAETDRRARHHRAPLMTLPASHPVGSARRGCDD